MLRLLIILAVAGVAAYFTKPTAEAMEAKAKAAVEAPAGEEGSSGVLEGIVATVKGWSAGDGVYTDYYIAAQYTADLPGSDYIDCWGAFALVRCDIKNS